MEWFRFYHEVVNDPKVQRLPAPLFKHWINVLCLASMNRERGMLPSVADLAFGLRLPESKVRQIVGELVSAELIDREGETFRMHGWANRQKRSDDVTARVQKHRASNDDETLRETEDETLRETLPHVRATEQSRDREEQNPQTPKGVSYPADFLQFWMAYPVKKAKGDALAAWRRAKGKPPLDDLLAAIERQRRSSEWTKDGGKFIPHPATWLRRGQWDDEIAPPVVSGRPDGMPPEIARLPWNNADRLKWEYEHRQGAAS